MSRIEEQELVDEIDYSTAKPTPLLIIHMKNRIQELRKRNYALV
jgi:hypothetical protein